MKKYFIVLVVFMITGVAIAEDAYLRNPNWSCYFPSSWDTPSRAPQNQKIWSVFTTMDNDKTAYFKPGVAKITWDPPAPFNYTVWFTQYTAVVSYYTVIGWNFWTATPLATIYPSQPLEYEIPGLVGSGGPLDEFRIEIRAHFSNDPNIAYVNGTFGHLLASAFKPDQVSGIAIDKTIVDATQNVVVSWNAPYSKLGIEHYEIQINNSATSV